MKLPKHLSCHIDHNDHKAGYETVEQYISDEMFHITDEDWATETSRQRAIETDSLWSIQIYPSNSISFYKIYGAELQEVVDSINEALKEPND